MNIKSITVRDGRKGNNNGKYFNGLYLAKIPGAILNQLLLELHKSGAETAVIPWGNILLIAYGNSSGDHYKRRSIAVLLCKFIKPVALQLGFAVRIVYGIGIEIKKLDI